MPDVEQAFQSFLAGMNLSGHHVNAALERGSRLKEFVKTEIKVSGVFWGGSFRRGTSVGPLSRAKLHVVLNPKYFYEYQKNSRKLLNFLKNRLSREYENLLTGREGQVVTVKFPDLPYLEVIPSIKLSEGNFIIPNGIGGWIKTNPARQEALFKDKEEASGGQFKNLVKIMKAWNIQAGRPFNPYFLELLVYYRANDFTRTYGEYLNSLFLSKILFLPEFLSCPAVREPVSLGDLAGVRQKIEDAYSISSRALNERDDESAIQIWRSLLGEKFGNGENQGL